MTGHSHQSHRALFLPDSWKLHRVTGQFLLRVTGHYGSLGKGSWLGGRSRSSTSASLSMLGLELALKTILSEYVYLVNAVNSSRMQRCLDTEASSCPLKPPLFFGRGNLWVKRGRATYGHFRWFSGFRNQTSSLSTFLGSIWVGVFWVGACLFLLYQIDAIWSYPQESGCPS